MKRMLLMAAVAAAALAGCSKGTENQAQQKVMSFETYVAKNVKSVPVTGNQFANGSSVGIYTYTSPTDWTTDGIAGSTAYMTNVQLTKTAGAWDYSPHMFWVANKKYTFFAYAPYKASPGVTNGVLGYAVPTDASTQEDLMVAKPAGGTTDKVWDGSTDPANITFAFSHALSQVKFSLKTPADYTQFYDLKLTSITIKQVSTSGSVSLLDGTWSAQGTPGDYAAQVNTSLVLDNSGFKAAEAGGNVLMLVPQDLANVEVEIGITVTPTVLGDAGVSGLKTVKAKIVTGKWEAGKIYNYQVTLDLSTIVNLKEMVFGEPSIDEWAPGSNPEI